MTWKFLTSTEQQILARSVQIKIIFYIARVGILAIPFNSRQHNTFNLKINFQTDI